MKQPDDVSIWYHLGRFILAVMIAPVMILTAILIPMLASHIQSTREMKYGIIALVVFTLILAVALFKAARR